MTDCDCSCSTFGNPDGSPHEAEARHPRPRSCKHDADPEPPEVIPYAKWRDEQGNIYISFPPDGTVPHG